MRSNDLEDRALRAAVSEQLRVELTKQRKTQRWLSEQSGIDEQSVGRYLRGDRSPQVEAWRAMAEVFGWTVGELVTRAEAHLPEHRERLLREAGATEAEAKAARRQDENPQRH